MAGRAAKLTASRRAEEIFRIPALPVDQPICDIFSFPVGKATFVLVTTLCLDRKKTGTTWLFRMSSTPPFEFEPDPVLTLSLFHPRNIALSPEAKGARWLWIADHGLDQPPFPGGSSPLYRIPEWGKVQVRDDPLLQQPAFSFDGCLWECPATGELFLYQCNIGVSAPRLLRWQSPGHQAEDVSARLPRELLALEERFLVSRILASDGEGIDLFLGGDFSDPRAAKHERDLVLRIPYCGKAVRSDHLVPARLKDATWSTVDAQLFELAPGEQKALLALYHDFGFTEGAAEILPLDQARLSRARANLPLPSLAGQRTWIARAAIGDLDGDGRNDIVFYLRSTDGALPVSRNNLFLLRQNAGGKFEYATCHDSGYEAHFPGGFFVGNNLIQVRSDGAFQQTWFSF